MAATKRRAKKRAKQTSAKKTAGKRVVAKKSPAPKKHPTKASPSRNAVERLRSICLALPETAEVEAWGEPTFRVKGKIFAMHATSGTHHSPERPAVARR